MAPATVATRLKILRTWSRWMVEVGALASDPTAGLRVSGVQGRRRLRRPQPVPTEEAAELFASYHRDQARRGLSARTIASRRATLSLLVVHAAPTRLLDVTRHDLEGWLDSCAIGVRSRHTYLSTARSFYDWAEREGLRADNPARRIPLPRQTRLVPRPISDEDLALAIKGADPRMKAWLLLAAFEGLRCKEIAGLRAEDIFEDRDPPMLLVSAPKGGRERLLPLHPAVEAALRVLGLPARGFVFTLDDGRAMSAQTVAAYIGRYLQSIGVQASAHNLRHWFATTVFARCKDLRVTQELLGHASPQTTAIYVGWSPTDAAAVVRSLSLPA